MHLTSLDVSSVRNLGNLNLKPGKEINLIYGDNGAGKTSLLEAIAILSTGKSFRAGKITSIIRTGSELLTVSASVENQSTKNSSRLGIQRSRHDTLARVDGVNIKRLSLLATSLPTVIISTRNHELIEGGPSERRRFLDWLLFHVEPDYLNYFRRYRVALQQRNAALRARSPDDLVCMWNTELAETGELISEGRLRMLNQFSQYLVKTFQQSSGHLNPQFSYKPGWQDEKPLKQALANLDNCRRRGITTIGPHRADMLIKDNSQEVKYIYSKGQQKLIAIQMKLAQIELYIQHHHQAPVVLLDDLPSELDEQARKFVFDYLQDRGAQIFLTSVDDVSKEIHGVSKVFHMKQGEIEKVLY